jgi:single-stranded-DNA-specific exonuclease
LKNVPEAWLIFAVDASFNEGVVGLAASRLVEAYYRPAIVGHYGEEYTRASCRSIPEFHITEALDQCADLLIRHGGHRAAAGFTVKNTNLPKLIKRLKAIAKRALSKKKLRPVLHADEELVLSPELGKTMPNMLGYFNQFQPFGIGNPEICFISRNLWVKNKRTVGKDNSHLKLKVCESNNGPIYEAIAFRQGHWLEQLPERIDLLYSIEINEFRGQHSLQLNVKDIKPVGVED